jgi:demethylmenaquinone methyltransferase/2-methoxy-6-polyprenyl-1,4-benzoquinol methylase
MSVHDQIGTPAGKRHYVRGLFATIADRYDFITVVLSYGQDRRWKRRLVDLAAARPGLTALDLATGTGDIAFGLAARGAAVVGLDVTPRMIELAQAKAGAGRNVRFVVGDMLALPFPGRSFDVVTVGYGLRNVTDLDTAIDELFRVTRPGGRVVSLDFNRPANRVVRALYLAYLTSVGGALGWALHRDPDTYRYIPASLRTYPGARGVAAMLRARGFVRVAPHPVLGGLMSIHIGTRSVSEKLEHAPTGLEAGGSRLEAGAPEAGRL